MHDLHIFFLGCQWVQSTMDTIMDHTIVIKNYGFMTIFVDQCKPEELKNLCVT